MILSPPKVRTRIAAARAPGVAVPAPHAGAAPVIPYDYAATFKLRGIPGNVAQDVINISPDGVFVAVAIGFGLVAERGRPLVIFPLDDPVIPPPGPTVPGDINLRAIPQQALLEGFRVSPVFQNVVFKASSTGLATDSPDELEFSGQAVPAAVINNLFQRVKAPEDIFFLFSMVDTSSGRELQDAPTHNLASLGISNGERPFRPLAQPLYFMPRSTLRMQIEEQSEGVEGTLFIVLYGYKILAATTCPEPVVRSLRGSPLCLTETIGRPSEKVIPFDYVATLSLTGHTGNRVEDELTINAEGGFVATALGYGLAVKEQEVKIEDAAKKAAQGIPLLIQGDNLDLQLLPLSVFPPSALVDGIRIRSALVRLAFESSTSLSTAFPLALSDSLFERLNRPEDVSFRYNIQDTGTGRDWQNQAINNIAGLGIANGKRPFKSFLRPMILLPRSTIRITIEERFGRGSLFLAFQGYKLLGGALPGRLS